MPVTKPDATVFDNDADSIATSRPELFTLATSFNTIADEYNAGTLGGGGGVDLGTPDVKSAVTSYPTDVTITNAYTQIPINTNSSGVVNLYMDSQPADSVWRVVLYNINSTTGVPSAKVSLEGDSAGDAYSGSTLSFSASGVMHSVRKLSTTDPNFNVMIFVDSITADSKVA
jgi:hypothetical protein